MNKLKPCPFCGIPPVQLICLSRFFDFEDRVLVTIKCPRDKCAQEEYLIVNKEFIKLYEPFPQFSTDFERLSSAMQEVAKKWNTRHE